MGNKILYSSKTENKNGKLRGSFFVSSLRRGSSLRRMSWMSRPHLDCRAWLIQIELPQYSELFSGFIGVEELLYFDEEKIRELGVKTSSHRSIIMKSLSSLREKYEKNQKLKVDKTLRASLIEGEESENLKLQLGIAPEVVLRNGGRSSDRKNAYKREAALISPNKIIHMSFDMDAQKPYEPDEGELRKLLDWELCLDSADLRSHAWYHGSIPRQRSEEVVTENGQFIIRDCISQPGDYVLTCRWNDQTIHVIIQKTILQPHTVYERIQYKLEEEGYDAIPDLVTAYVGEKRAVTKCSGARITTPVNRTAPLTFYLSKYAAQAEHTKLHGTLSRPVSKPASQRSSHNFKREPIGVGCTIVRTSTNQSPPRMRRDSGPATAKGQRPSSGVFDERSNSSDGAIVSSKNASENTSFSSQSLPRRFPSSNLSLPPQPNIDLTTSDDLNPDLKILTENPPPKPSRVPSFKVKPRKPPVIPGERIYSEIDEDEVTLTEEKLESELKAEVEALKLIKEKENGVGAVGEVTFNPRYSRLSEVYHPSGSDSGNGSGDSVQTSASDSRNRDSQMSFGDSAFNLAEEDSVADDDVILLTLPDMYPPSSFDLDNFSTLLLPAIENRPLDATAFKGIKNTLTESGSRILAAHLTKVDLDVLNGSPDKDYGLGIDMGVEMLTLPQGSQLRKDLIERTECLKLLVAISVLKTEELNERAEMIYRWIQIAIDTKTAMGNLYGFTGIMLGLCVPEVQRLSQTWHTVRQKYTDSAFKFESKLRSTLKSMNECTNPQAPNTIIPHVLPFILLCERDLEDIYSLHKTDDSLLQWESTCADYGLQMLLTHLQEGRTFTQNLNFYKRNAELILGDMVHMEELTLDMFRTEFHLKFLFGSKAAYADNEERMPKFQKVISTLSEYCEPSV